MTHRSFDPALRDVAAALLLMLVYLLVWNTASLTLRGAPGSWEFALAILLALPVALYGRRLSLPRLRSDLAPLHDEVVLAAAAGLAMLALWGTRPGVNGTFDRLPASVLAVAAIAGGEEVLFRGTILPAVARRFGRGWGLLISASLFGALHLEGGLNTMATAFLLGLALGGLYLRNGLGTCVAFHAAFNLLIGPIFGLPVGGVPWPGLLEPAVARNPLDFWLVQAAALVLAVGLIPWRSLRLRPTE